MANENKRIIEEPASSEIYNDDWFLKDSVLQGTTKISAGNLKELLTGDINDRADKLLRNIIGPTYEWSASKTYKAGAIVYYEDSLYFCIVDTATVGTFVPSEWRYTDLYENLTGKINSVIKMLAPYMQFSDISTIMPYSKGDIVRYQPTGTYKEKFYVAKEDLPEGIESYDPNDWDEYDTLGELIAGIMAEAGKVDDVKVDGTSVVTNKVAEIEIPVKDVEVDGTSVVNEQGVAEITLPDVPVQDVQVKTDSTYDSVVDASGNAKIDLSSMTAYGEVPNLPQAIATFTDGADDIPMKSLVVEIEPVQDLHGYDSPWVGGAGKNKLLLTVDRIKSDNTSGSWSGNTYSINGAEYKINTDNAGNVISISARNLASNPNGDLRLVFTLSSGSYILSSGFTETNGTNDSYLQKNGVTIARGNNSSPGPNFTLDSSSEVVYHLRLSKSGDSSYIAYPMIRLASVADATFAPYSNICPISGWDEVDVTRCGKNICEGANSFLISYSAQTGVATRITGTGTCLVAHVKEGYTYTFSNGENVNRRIVTYWDSTPSIGDSTSYAQSLTGNSFTAIKDGLVIIYIYNASIDTSVAQIELGSIATTYEPYTGSTYTIDLGETRYGGEVDVVNGGGTDRLGYVVFDGSNDEAWGNYSSNYKGFPIIISNSKIDATNPSTQLMCDKLAVSTVRGPSGEKQIKTYTSTSDNNAIFVSIDGITDKAVFLTYLSNNNIEIVYPLATPTTYDTQPTAIKSLKGANNIWADTGDIDKAEYQRDATTIINELIARIEALEG